MLMVCDGCDRVFDDGIDAGQHEIKTGHHVAWGSLPEGTVLTRHDGRCRCEGDGRFFSHIDPHCATHGVEA